MRGRLAAPAVVGVLLAALVAAPQRVCAASPQSAPGGSYRAVPAKRVLDTRSGLGAPTGPKTSVNLVIAGKAGVPASQVSAFAVNITVTAPSTAGYVIAYASGTARPNTAALRYAAGQTVAAMTIVPVGTGGSITLFSSASTQLILDVQGYFTDVATADNTGLFTSAAARLMDTRSGLGGKALRDDLTVWRFDPASRSYEPVYGLTDVKLIGGDLDTSAYAVT